MQILRFLNLLAWIFAFGSGIIVLIRLDYSIWLQTTAMGNLEMIKLACKGTKLPTVKGPACIFIVSVAWLWTR